MDGKCCHCKKNPAEKCGELQFEYQDIKFKVFRCGSECSECVKRYRIEKFEKVPKGVITPVLGKLPKVDWQKYLQIDKGDRDYHGGPFDQATLVLVDIGVLFYSETANDCWVVSGCGMNLGPSNGTGGKSFASKEDAEEYARIRYARAMYAVSVSHQTAKKFVNR